MSTYAITFDTDWAPDYMIEECCDLCNQYNIPATFFFTHPSSVADTLCQDPNYEIGIHPNFFQNTTQILGGTSKKKVVEDDFFRYAAVLEYCHFYFPDAIGMRTHALYKSTYLYSYIVENCKNIKYDVSTFISSGMDFKPWEEWYPYACDANKLGKLLFIPFFWEDDLWFIFSDRQKKVDSLNLQSSSICIYNFHPIHIYLNTVDVAHYRSAKKYIREYEEIKKYKNNKEKGVRDFFVSLLDALHVAEQQKVVTLKDVWSEYEHCDHR